MFWINGNESLKR